MSQVTLKAANRDLHSGLYGGSALNPINALARILGDLQDANGRIQLPGFYDKVKPISNAQRAQWDALGFDERAFLGKIGLESRPASAATQRWSGCGRGRPPISTACGAATPAPAARRSLPRKPRPRFRSASCRVRTPTTCFEQFKRFVNERLPPGAVVEDETARARPASRSIWKASGSGPRRRCWPMNTASRPCSSAAAARSQW